MKLIKLGTIKVKMEGVFLTQEEYEKHPAYHPLCFFKRPRLFVSEDGENWLDVGPGYESQYQLLEATPDEHAKMWAEGYRMLGLERPMAHRCKACNKAMSDKDSFYGKNMWHCNRPTCGHGEFILCPSCGLDEKVKWSCSLCGCEMLYC